MAKINPWTTKIVVIGFALLAIALLTSFGQEVLGGYANTIALLVVIIALGLEVGKRVILNPTEVRGLKIVSLLIFLVLAVNLILTVLGVGLPNFLERIQDPTILIGAIWIIAEVLFIK